MAVQTEIDVQKRELVNLLDDLTVRLKQIRDFQPERKAKMAYCEHLVGQAKAVKEAYVLELRTLGAEERQPYVDFLKEKLVEFNKLQQVLEHKRIEIDRDQLVEEELPAEADGDPTTVENVIKQGDEIQDKSKEAISRMKQQVLDAEEIGIATAAKMDEQTAQMQRIGEGLDDVQYNIDRSKATVNQIAKGAAKDRCIQIMCGCSILLLIIIIILVIVG